MFRIFVFTVVCMQVYDTSSGTNDNDIGTQNENNPSRLSNLEI